MTVAAVDLRTPSIAIVDSITYLSLPSPSYAHHRHYISAQRPRLPDLQFTIMVSLFSVPAFFVLFRETLEAAIILSVMMAVLDRMVEDGLQRRRMKRHVWWGVVGGVLLSMAAAAVFLALYYTVAKEAWESSEPLWEGILGLVAVALITVMAFSMVRVDTWKRKWERKLTKATEATMARKGRYALVLLPLSIVLREGCEAVIFLGGIGLRDSGTALPIPAVVGAACGVLVGWLLYKGCGTVGFRYFLLCSTALLLVIAAGLFAGSVHELEEYRDDEHFLWKLHCCHQGDDGVWKILNAVVGWRDEATVGTLVSYLCFWAFVAAAFLLLRVKWKRDAEREAAEAKLQLSLHKENIIRTSTTTTAPV